MLFKDNFKVQKVDREGKFFDNVSRLEAVGKNSFAKLCLDYHSGILKMAEEENFELCISNTLQPDSKLADNTWDFRGRKSLLDLYDYAMSGRVFKIDGDPLNSEKNFVVYASFGGLIAALTADYKFLLNLEMDSEIFILVKKA